ncbi:hypothetical protein CEP54_015754 [Fusarium duplospermum]|uniref:Protein kinase domain-containing protein n=1 Tax=Fusarium duplospermum TaxID=1325734 RepID=A0A428NLJ3_9HYPO|nr:hypothetical protein CEP54_015754 [Fusarium duplospermum]
MEKNKEELAVPLTSDETLSDIRELSIRCRELLHQLSADDGPADGAEARELMAGFNIWAANMGVFRDGQQSLTSRLKNAPQICELVQQLLMVLERDLEKEIIQGGGQEGSSSASESENSSDRSSTSSYRLLSPSDDDKDLPSPPPPQPTIRTSIHDIITSLRQLALTVRLAGARHREERIQRFKNLDRNKQVYQVVKKFARQMVDFRFDKASESLRERMAESIATRRARFLYLEQHQKKTSTLNEPAPTLQQMAPEEEEYTPPAIQPEQQQAATVLPPQKDHLGPSVRASVMLSATDRTELDLKQVQAAPNKTKRAESVSSVKIAMGTLPSIPKLDPGGLSFTCPYCFLVCPAKEASGQKQWLHQREDETMLDVAAKFGQNSTRIEHTGGKFTPEQREATIWAPLHTQRRPSTMEPLYAQLNKSLRTCPLEARFPKFLPLDELEKVTLENIQAELPMTTQLFSPGLPHKVASEAKRVFCILVLMEEAAAIAQLIKEGITDEDLPLCRNDDDENDSEYNVLASVGSNKRFPSTMSWGQGVQVENFLKKQWVVQSPIFDKPGSHLVLDPECALPLTECETEHAKGDMSVVHKAKLHPAHQHIFPADAEAYVAIKEFHKKEVFTREKDNLDIIQRLQNGHLIPLLASCERGSTYYLLFPWANGGTLRDFWGEHDCKPRTTGLIRWALEQILGLVDGIRALHNHNIRHGDIKPQNILVFEEHQGANLATLVLADMGGSKFHKEATDLRSSATMTAESTVSYEAPETDDDQQNNTPRPRRYDMWSAGCMFLEFTVWLVYDFAAVNGFHKKRKDQNDPVSPGNFFSREPGQSTRIHPAVTEAVRHLRKHPLCKHGTALGDLVAVINDRLLQIKPADRALAPELYDRVKTIVDAAAAKPEYLGQEVKPPLPTPEFFSPPGSRKGSSS